MSINEAVTNLMERLLIIEQMVNAHEKRVAEIERQLELAESYAEEQREQRT